MCLYLRTKFQVSRIILTSFRQGEFYPPLQNKSLISSPRLGTNWEKEIGKISIRLLEKWVCFIRVMRNEKPVCNHGPNWAFHALMLRIKLYQNSFFFIVLANTKWLKSKTVTTNCGIKFFILFVIITIFSFPCQDSNVSGSNLQ